MIPGWQIAPDVWEPIRDNPTITSLDGERRAPLAVICSPTWTWPERWEFGVFEIVDAQGDISEGMERVREIFTFDSDTNTIVRGWVLEARPPFEPIKRDRIRRPANATQ